MVRDVNTSVGVFMVCVDQTVVHVTVNQDGLASLATNVCRYLSSLISHHCETVLTVLYFFLHSVLYWYIWLQLFPSLLICKWYL